MSISNLSGMIGVQTQKNVSDQLYTRISDLILNGELPEGYVFPNENEMCEQLNVGRTTLREAYKGLELSGYVTRTKRGTVVNGHTEIMQATPMIQLIRSASPEDFNEFRIMLETKSAYLAAMNAGLSDVKKLEEINQNMRNAYNEKNLETMIENDMKFHESIARCSRNSLLVATLEIMIEYWLGSIRDNFRTRAEKDFRLFDQNITEHNQIIEAIRERNPDAASKAMTNHILSATKRL